MSVTTMVAPEPSLAVLLRALKLPTFARLHEEIAQKAEQEGWSFSQYLRHLAMLEVEERRTRHHPHAHGRELPNDWVAVQAASFCQVSARQRKRKPPAGHGSRARAPVGLQHVTIHVNRPLANGAVVHGTAQRATDHALDLARSPARAVALARRTLGG